MKSLRGNRTEVRDPRSKGFTLIELMIVVAILAVAGTVILTGIRQDRFTNQYVRFVEDVAGHVIQARAMAIDDSTRVQIQVFPDRMDVLLFNEVNNSWIPLFADHVASIDGGGLTQMGGQSARGVCFYGLQSGVMAPEQGAQIAAAAPPPSACVGGGQILQFEPDGTFSDQSGNINILGDSGVTLWLADRRVVGNTRLSIVQIYPGGLIRTFHDLGS